MMTERVVRIGCGAGFWGDSPDGARQLVESGGIDYLMLDYLAEITMSILARMKARRSDLGYAPDFVTMVMAPLAAMIARRSIKVVTNAGGLNPAACRDALAAVFEAAGVTLRVAIVEGDDLAERIDAYRQAGVTEMFSGLGVPDRIASANAYLGAFPIAAAFDAGADIVITGRVADSALALGALIHEYGWSADDHDRLAAGSLAGHIIECGVQATGGVVTDWRGVADGWSDMGFPIAECRADGSFDIVKPDGTGGLISRETIAEQIVYEVGDPAAYILPDVICDWRHIRVEQAGEGRVRISGARGRPPSSSFKVSATWRDGYRAAATMMLVGRDAADRARSVGEAILARARRLMSAAGERDFNEVLIEILGDETSYGRHRRVDRPREVVLKIAVRHDSRTALEIFAREIYPAATAMAQGLTGFAGGRPEPQPVIRLFSFLADKADVVPHVTIDGARIALPPAGRWEDPVPPAPAGPFATAMLEGPMAAVPLVALAFGRSGDKGDLANVGVLARRPEYVAALAAAVTPEAVRDRLGHYVEGKVERFDWPGLDGFNLVLHRALGGGGVASLRHDPQGKALAQILMDMPVAVPARWLDADGPLGAWTGEVQW